MKKLCIPVLLSLSLLSCARTHVSKTYIATGATDPSAIYIKPFDIGQAQFTGSQGHTAGELPIRRSLAPMEFAKALRTELEKMAPAMVLKNGEVPTSGWIVEGEFDVVDGGSRTARGLLPPTPIGQSNLVAHVRVIDVAGASGNGSDAKKEGDSPYHGRGNVIYAFDIHGTSGSTGRWGSVHAGGIGQERLFDFQNAAEEILMVLSTNPKRYGVRESPR